MQAEAKAETDHESRLGFESLLAPHHSFKMEIELDIEIDPTWRVVVVRQMTLHHGASTGPSSLPCSMLELCVCDEGVGEEAWQTHESRRRYNSNAVADYDAQHFPHLLPVLLRPGVAHMGMRVFIHADRSDLVTHVLPPPRASQIDIDPRASA